MKYQMIKCKRKNPCVDCDITDCYHYGMKQADCPKITCDQPDNTDCETNCAFIDDYIKQLRESGGC